MKGIFEKFENYMVAASFAEAGESETALEMLQPQKRVRQRKRPQTRREAPRPRPEMKAPSMDE